MSMLSGLGLWVAFVKPGEDRQSGATKCLAESALNYKDSASVWWSDLYAFF